MSFFDILSLLGGLAMFLYGMRLMGDSLKENSSGTFKIAMEHVTNNPVKAFILGLLVTALIQSSTATIVITAGLVGAGILTLRQSLGIIVGANVGTTVTGQIIRLLDLDTGGGTSWLRIFQPAALSSLALILGMVIIMSGRVRNSKSIGGIAIGFGILFSGLLNMTGAVNALAESGLVEDAFAGLGANPLLGYLTGAGIAFLLQSSSATVGILQAFSATGMLTFKAIYAVIVGIYLGDCVTTAIVCSIGAEPDAKRVGVVNILFNLSETVLVLAGVAVVHRMGLLDGLWDRTVNSGLIANTNTVFNLTCAVCLFPLLNTYETLSRKLVPAPAPGEAAETARQGTETALDASLNLDAQLNPVFFDTPALALNSCYKLLLSTFITARTSLRQAMGLLEHFDADTYQEILQKEEEIDRVTDGLSRYAMELLPRLQLENHVAILDQYYKVIADFERLGDYAVNIANNAESLSRHEAAYSEEARQDLEVLKESLREILDLTELAFRKRNVEAAFSIEPRVQAAEELLKQLRRNHMTRIRAGACKTYAAASFTSLMIEIKRITSVCSNVGVATVVRVYPEVADQEHRYYERLRSGGNEKYDAELRAAQSRFLSRVDPAARTPDGEAS